MLKPDLNQKVLVNQQEALDAVDNLLESISNIK